MTHSTRCPTVRAALSLALFSLLLASCDPLPPRADQLAAHGHEHEQEHDHEQEHEQEHELDPVTTTVFGEKLLLFLEHPRLIVGESARFLAHWSVLDTGEPVRSGRVSLRIGDVELAALEATRDGLFIPEGALPTPGRYAMSIELVSNQGSERLDLGELMVHADEVGAHAAADAEAVEAASGEVPFLMEQQWRLSLLLAEAGPRELVERLVVPARLVTAEGASAVVSAPVAGRLLPLEERDALPRSGERVEKGQPLVVVEPPLSTSDAAELAALHHEWSLHALTIERDWASAQTDLGFAELERERVQDLHADGLATQQQLDRAERDVALGEIQLDGAQAAREAVSDLESHHAVDSVLAVEVAAPIGGVVIARGKTLGEHVEAGDELLRVVDPARLWVEGHVSEFDLARLPATPSATVSTAADPAARVALGGDSGNAWLGTAPEIDTGSRTLLVRFALDSVSPGLRAGLRAGMLADLELAVGQSSATVVIPYEAVVMDQGMPTAYVMLDGETFQRRDLRLGLRDGPFVEVLSGVAAGEHVATRGAHVVRQAALAPASFVAGHAH